MKTIRNALTGLAALATVAFSSGCSSPDDAIQAARAQGWKDVQITSSAYVFQWTCQGGEKKYHIKGINPAGQESQANVCCGHSSYKGCTIRF